MTVPDSRKGLILILTCMAQFMVVLDFAIVNVALPSIQRDLDLRQSTLQWIVIAYGLLLGGFVLLGGRLGDQLGRRRILLAGMAIFSAASLLAGLAQSGGLLIGARGLQGFGAALMAPSALSILGATFSEGQERNRALGIFGAVGGSSASVGVIASGLLTGGPGWRWIFFINVPIGLALIALTVRFLPADRFDEGVPRYDLAGATSVTAGLLLLIYGLNRGATHGWRSGSEFAIFAGAAILMGLFVGVESRAKAPLVPGAILRNRTMIAADLAAFLFVSGFYSFIFLGTLLFQQLLDYSPTRAGFAWLATSLTAFLAAAATGSRLASSFGVKRLLIAGGALLGTGAALFTRVSPGSNYLVDLLPALLLVGVAVGLASPSLQIGALSGATGPTVGLASGLVETMREIGGAVGVAIVSTVLISHTGDTNTIDNLRGPEVAGFHSAFIAIAILAALGAFVSLIAFPRSGRSAETRAFELEGPVLETAAPQ